MWQQAHNVRLLAMDIDGVLTDGRIWLDLQGNELKTFHVHDGQGIAMAHQAGLRTAWISGRASAAVRRRATELGVTWVYENVKAKVPAIRDIMQQAQEPASAVAYIGDDLIDVPVFHTVGLSIAVASAPPDVRAQAAWVTRSAGGAGAVREVIDLILRLQGRWDAVVQELFGTDC
ncbi:KdsC family phosphatase [Candidatus Entotheonella palauensis]|nr:HAD hydrolase family protein [Candidatus Entotheonella palauensis]